MRFSYITVMRCYIYVFQNAKMYPIPHLLFGLFSSLRLSVIFTLHTNHFWLLCHYVVVDDQGRQLPTFDAASVQAFAVSLDLQAAAGVMPVDNCRALGCRNQGLIFVP